MLYLVQLYHIYPRSNWCDSSFKQTMSLHYWNGVILKYVCKYWLPKNVVESCKIICVLIIYI
jgi:hypothetical protein